jgi:predicted deacetylase
MTFQRQSPASHGHDDALKVVISLHDVTPVHAARIARAERLLATLGVTTVTYLLVPDFHRSGPAHEREDFIGWCRAARPFRVQWFLHGYYHHEIDAPQADDAVSRGRGVRTRLAAAFMTAGEGEFLTLRGQALADRLDRGIASFTACLGAAPEGFVAPAWLFDEALLPALAARGIRFTENHLRVFDVLRGRQRECGVITWATRTALRKYGSLIVSRALGLYWRRRPVLRVALHPLDFDHPMTIASIARTLDAVREQREMVSYDHRLFAD